MHRVQIKFKPDDSFVRCSPEIPIQNKFSSPFLLLQAQAARFAKMVKLRLIRMSIECNLNWFLHEFLHIKLLSILKDIVCLQLIPTFRYFSLFLTYRALYENISSY